MAVGRDKAYILQKVKGNEFDVANDDYAALVVKGSGEFHYFYDRAGERLIKTFLLREGSQVDTLCDVVLAGEAGALTPRLRVWKKDKTKPGKPVSEEVVSGEVGVLAKAFVDLGDCAAELWRLLGFLQTVEGVGSSSEEFRVTTGAGAELLESLEGHDKAAVLAAVRTRLDGELTEQDMQMLVNRRRTVLHFRRLLEEEGFIESETTRLSADGIERVWQLFFEDNPWIFGYGLTLVACEAVSDEGLEAITSGANVFTGGGKRIDAAMRTRGFIQSLVFAEIKRHDTPLLMTNQYRKPDVYQVSRQVSGAVAQVQKTTHKAVAKLQDLHRQHTDTGSFEFEVSTIAPRQIVIVGHLGELAPSDQVNIEKMSSFELFRRNQNGVEIITFDELYERARFIVESIEAAPNDL
jgi:hypothetical protein